MSIPLPSSRRVNPLAEISRRDFLRIGAATAALTLTAGGSRPLTAAEVEFLAEVQQPPANVPAPERPLAPLLQGPDGTPITTRAGWEPERLRLRKAWLDFLGPMPDRNPKITLEVLKEDRPEGCVRQLVRYEGEPGLMVEGYLLRPDPAPTGKAPGLVALHQTNNTSIEEIAGVNGGEEHQIGLKLCRRGFVVFCPRCYLYQTPPAYKIDVKQTVVDFHARHPKTLGMHKMLYDAQRAVDVLASLDYVDPQRLGTVGHSLGAKEAFYLAAFDDRIRAVVASEGGTGFKSTNWNSPWYLGTGIESPEFKLNHHQLIALIAPRALLILGGESGPGAADGARSWPYVAAALPVHKLDNTPARLGLYIHGKGHSIPAPAWDRLVAWLETYTA